MLDNITIRYFFIINVLLDVMNECLSLYNRPYMNNETIEIDSLGRQQVIQKKKIVFYFILKSFF